MKKLFWVLSLMAALSAQAIVVNAPSSLEGYYALDGNKAYQWGISLNLAPGEEITYAKITFSNVKLAVGNSSGTGKLHTDLLNLNTTGVIVKTDNDAPGDYFKSSASGLPSSAVVTLGTQFFSYVGQTLSWSYTFTTSQLASLNSFAADGKFNLGFDPDCHYTVGDIYFTYETISKTTSVPDGGNTLILLGFLLVCVYGIRNIPVRLLAKF